MTWSHLFGGKKTQFFKGDQAKDSNCVTMTDVKDVKSEETASCYCFLQQRCHIFGHDWWINRWKCMYTKAAFGLQTTWLYIDSNPFTGLGSGSIQACFDESCCLCKAQSKMDISVCFAYVSYQNCPLGNTENNWKIFFFKLQKIKPMTRDFGQIQIDNIVYCWISFLSHKYLVTQDTGSTINIFEPPIQSAGNMTTWEWDSTISYFGNM